MTKPAPEVQEQLPAELRRDKIKELLATTDFVRVLDISEAFGVTTVTARADLDQLAGEGYARRVHGGAVGLIPGDVEQPIEATRDTERNAKAAIAAAAAQLVESGQTIVLDVGSTTMALAAALVARTDLSDVTVITNGLTIALELEQAIPRLSVIVTGGMLRPLQHSLVQPLATELFTRVNADLAFIGCNGVHPERGVTNVNLQEVDVKRAMMAASGTTVVLADATKIGSICLGTIADTDSFDLLITDARAPAPLIDRFADAGLPCIVASSSTEET
ncbi:DeoR/GlpR family DNA-binding transcription regulator [Lysinibacter sp. HNR]|uniref:DeoR/GlpR family DNA-binding transcription regulator n=1 Tax=Lysinibacter sp. HNR TaxID=3031408 RepID=UPI002435BF07|nr:DeoR/GlpR family DNA-binding transcription regulator [Lysinibacter sp. HNR]WGD36973.1 DeoR/GlpR family DNA-binding transcription regulator [Lysinibacter sp. HNR]